MDLRDENTYRLERIEEKLEVLSEDHRYMMKRHGRLQGRIYGLLAAYGLAWLFNHLNWFWYSGPNN